MNDSNLTMLCVGDIILGKDAQPYFDSVHPFLESADVIFGQLEVPYTSRDEQSDELERHPEYLEPLVKEGFSVLALAGNHLADAGDMGIEDTINWLRDHEIEYVGAGMNISEARRPVILERNKTRIGILKYNCVGPEETWATSNKPGCAYVKVLTHYELQHANPGGPPSIYTFAEPQSKVEMENDIKELRKKCDVLVVSFHKGLVHQPAKIAAYERELSHAAIDAGADLILGEHAHLLKGVEIYKGKTIFHGLCNFIAYVPSLFPKQGDDMEAWANKRIELFGFAPDPEYPTYPFHPEAIYTMLAKSNIENGKITSTSFIPCIVDKEGKPVVVGRSSGGLEVLEYMRNITELAGLDTQYEWSGDEIIMR
ncbi:MULTISPECIES: CapA family protein [Bacillaceae]|uniref:CapA family protein n=1 Tax=Evansella alkalicola TaxID=745819 RepID=A0ABS6K1D5_9BACI|nr:MULTISPECIES: CapA family protein [Bacillaceae]MBU9723180.1 CapA family protein [Bacillus alkalicola]